MSAPDQETEDGQPAFDEHVEDGKVTIYPTDVPDRDLKEQWITPDINDAVSVGGMR